MLVLTRGLPGSGKSTWARQWVAESSDSRVRVNRDDLRMMLFNKPYGLTREQEDEVTRVQQASVESMLKNGFDVVIDDTNLNARFAKDWLKVAAKMGVEVEWNDDFLAVPVQVCIDRDAQREVGHVGSDVIMRFYQRYNLGSSKPLKRPQLDAETLTGSLPYSGTPGRTKAFLVDIDGTIAKNNGHRGWFDWSKVGNDDPVKIIIEMVQHFELQGLRPIFVSGRDEVCHAETINWILDYVYGGLIPKNPIILHMRPENDGRKDSIVKLEIFDNYIRDKFDVQFALDDRDQVVKAYRSIGLTVLQVADGAF